MWGVTSLYASVVDAGTSITRLVNENDAVGWTAAALCCDLIVFSMCFSSVFVFRNIS